MPSSRLPTPSPASSARPAARLAAVLTAMLALMGSTLAVTASAAPLHTDDQPLVRQASWPGRGGYLALGDSVPFGYRPPAVTPASDYLDADNFVGFPDLVAQRLRVRLTNAACPGETTGSMITVGAQSNGCQSSVGSPVGYRTAYPLHTDYEGTQLAFAVDHLRHHRHTRLVTVMVGANDLFLCQRTTTDACTGSSFAATVAQVQANVDTILGTLRRAPYRHRLVVVSYYSTDYADPAQTGSIAALNAALARAAAAHRAVVADGFGAFGSATTTFGGSSCAAGLLVALPTGGCNVHPSAAGQRLLARAVLQADRP